MSVTSKVASGLATLKNNKCKIETAWILKSKVVSCGNVIKKKSPNAFDKNVQGEGKTVFWTDFAPIQLKRGIFGMCAKFYVISMYI